MAMVTVRVRMFPDPIQVDESEIPNLRSQGLLVDERDVLLAERDAAAAEVARLDAELAKLTPADTPPAESAPKAAKTAAKIKES